MITQIGLTAGDVWNHLDSCKGTDTFNNIIKAIHTDRDIILMSIGWLAREGHVIIDGRGPDYTIKLVSR